MESGSNSHSSGRAHRLKAEATSGPLRDALTCAEENGVSVFSQEDAPFEDVMTIDGIAGRAIVLLGAPSAALAALWIRWALTELPQIT